MPDEATTTQASAAPAVAEQAQADASAATKNTEPTSAEQMIPKSRFDEVNNRLKAIEAESVKAAKAAQDAETKRLAEEGKYKELFEKQQADLLAAQQVAKANELRLLQRDAATKTNLPAALADRLKGETLEEMVADAQSILDALPKPTAPNINANAGMGGGLGAGQLTEAQINEQAVRMGVNPKLLKQQYGLQ